MQMHILHIAHSIGKNSAAGRLCTALINNRCKISTLSIEESDFLESYKLSSKKYFINKFINKITIFPFKFYRKRSKKTPWSSHIFGVNIDDIIRKINPDIVHLHWIARSTINLSCLNKISLPILWTFHDVWPLTAGCHCNLGCNKWRNSCTSCSKLKKSIIPFDIARILFNNKLKIIKNINLSIIAPSKYIFSMAKASPIFKEKDIYHIPNAINTNIFSPGSSSINTRLNIQEECFVILFGATSINLYYKGFDLLKKSLQRIYTKYKNIHLIAFGTKPLNLNEKFPITFTGYIYNTEELVDIYRCANLYIAPSRQDVLNSTVIEASSCGIPCISFDIGGMSDIIINNKTGLLVKPFSINQLTIAIEYCINNKNKIIKCGFAARNHIINNFDDNLVAQKHINLYRKLIK
ncbi:MAG: glycosyltransferase [Desulfovibrio sp.]|nr:glycosyltransferase [Desulfovibrio sp.]